MEEITGDSVSPDEYGVESVSEGSEANLPQ